MVDGREDLLAVAHVSDKCCCLTADLGDLSGCGLDTVGTNVDKPDVGTVPGEPQRDSAADPPARPPR